jgi:hypothetical protein
VSAPTRTETLIARSPGASTSAMCIVAPRSTLDHRLRSTAGRACSIAIVPAS